MVSEKKKSLKVKIFVIISVVIAVGAIGAFLYHNHYKQKYKFKGLGDIYESRNQQNELYSERKITIGNKDNPHKSLVSQLPSFKKNIRSRLSDGNYLNLTLDFRFKKAEGIKEIRRKWERVEYAIHVALTPYTGKEIQNGSREEILVIVENQIRKRIFSEIKYVYLDKFDIES